MKLKSIVILSLCFTLLLVLNFGNKIADPYKINLRFNKNYPLEIEKDKHTGLLWALSYLGANLPKGSYEKALTQKDSTIYELNIEGIGFNTNALQAFKEILYEIKNSEEYEQKGGVDLGAFIVYTLGSSWHYYEITGASKTLEEYKNKHRSYNTVHFPILNSSVSSHNRLIELTDTNTISSFSFIAHEGNDSIKKGNFQTQTYEIFDVMSNGQLRFAIYNKDGQLIDSSPQKYSHAGKPIKCLWCHEINIQPLYSINERIQGYMSQEEFTAIIENKRTQLNEYRKVLESDIDFTKKQDHAFMEILYISFMQPSKYKLQHEWGRNFKKIDKIYNKNTTHDHHEYSFLKELLYRGQIKKLSPYKTIHFPDSIWEANKKEPNIFK